MLILGLVATSTPLADFWFCSVSAWVKLSSHTGNQELLLRGLVHKASLKSQLTNWK